MIPVTVLAFAVLAVASAAEAQVYVYGRAYRLTNYGGTYASNFQMKWCKADSRDLSPTSQCGYGWTNQFGDFNIDVTFYGPGYYYPYLWRDDIYWGSSTYPAAYPANLVYTPAGNQITGTLGSYPRALPPSAVYPANGSVYIPTQFTLQWSDGLDSERRRSDWPVTYDIYASGNDAPELLVFSNIPCNGVGTCSASVSGLSYSTRFQWRVVAKIKSTPIITWAGYDNTYSTSSGTFRFATTWDPAIPVYNFRTITGNYLEAVDAGTAGTFDAAGVANDYQSQFQLVDFNGGGLNSGDQVYIKTIRNYYVSAERCGGYGVTISGWAMNYELWTIIRVAGDGPISRGDQVAFRAQCGGYISANGGGGGSVNAAAQSIGTWETFTMN